LAFGEKKIIGWIGDEEEADLGAEAVAPLQSPESSTHEPLRRCDAPQHVDEHADSTVGAVGGVDPAGVADGHAAARVTLGAIDRECRRRSDDTAKRGQSVEEVGVHAGGAAPP